MIKKILSIAILCTVALSCAQGEDNLESSMLNAYKRDIAYIPPNQENLAKAEQLFSVLLKAETISENDIADWEQLGFKLQQVEENGITYAVLSESGAIAGHGFYLIKLNPSDPGYALQAPHRPSDLLTHLIALKMFVEGPYQAAAWSSTHRSSVDLCKEPNSYFNSFTKAFGENFTQASIVQLHAFDGKKRDTEYDMILSSTKKESPIWLSAASSCLRDNLAFNIAEYQKDIDDLGGTLNINAHNFYSINLTGQFFHVEMSASFRNNLLNNKELRDNLTSCVLGMK